jgi:CheY-like chemotaxis protein
MTRRIPALICSATSATKSKSAYSPVAALKVVETFRPEVAVLDIGLPVMDGYELAARLRANPVMVRVL